MFKPRQSIFDFTIDYPLEESSFTSTSRRLKEMQEKGFTGRGTNVYKPGKRTSDERKRKRG